MRPFCYTIYDHPLDYPDGFVVRVWGFDGGPEPRAGHAVSAPTLEAARAMIPPGAFNIERMPEDDPVIVETWVGAPPMGSTAHGLVSALRGLLWCQGHKPECPVGGALMTGEPWAHPVDEKRCTERCSAARLALQKAEGRTCAPECAEGDTCQREPIDGHRCDRDENGGYQCQRAKA